MKNVYIILLVLFIFISCNQNKNPKGENIKLIGTKWEWELSPQCINYFHFVKDNVYKEYNCELGEEWSGTYEIENDTVILREVIYTSDIPEKGTYETNEYRLIFSSNSLKLIYSKTFQNDKWEEKWVDNPTVFFRRID